MVRHHTGALRMAAFVFDIGSPGVGSLAKEIWLNKPDYVRYDSLFVLP